MSARTGAPRELLVATRNRGKAAELESSAASLGLRVVTLDDLGIPTSPLEDALECHPTFLANALAKARFYHAMGDGRPTVSDDSGLEVAALGGAPGVHSRRWVGAAGSDAEVSAVNNAALLDRLRGVADRGARFTCVVAYVDGRLEVTGEGVVRGRIAAAPRGEHGFGYDSLFEPEELGGRTFGEASAAEKQRMSHRARAFAALVDALRTPRGS